MGIGDPRLGPRPEVPAYVLRTFQCFIE
jgi:hypothetical protein